MLKEKGSVVNTTSAQDLSAQLTQRLSAGNFPQREDLAAIRALLALLDDFPDTVAPVAEILLEKGGTNVQNEVLGVLGDLSPSSAEAFGRACVGWSEKPLCAVEHLLSPEAALAFLRGVLARCSELARCISTALTIARKSDLLEHAQHREDLGRSLDMVALRSLADDAAAFGQALRT